MSRKESLFLSVLSYIMAIFLSVLSKTSFILCVFNKKEITLQKNNSNAKKDVSSKVDRLDALGMEEQQQP